ncbi:MAG: hypothetical protein QXE76_01530 [Candidatus Bathyarchaeia archaeon]
MMNIKRMNWLGIASAVTATILLVVSVAYATPWWQLSIAQGMGQINLSPLDYRAQLLGVPIEIPILWFVNLSAKLLLLSAIITLLLYSIVPNGKYAKNLLNYSYKRPLVLVIGLIVVVVILTFLANVLLPIDLDVPISGAATATITVENASINVPVTTGFTWAFWLAIITAALAIGAKIYHHKILVPKILQQKPSGK